MKKELCWREFAFHLDWNIPVRAGTLQHFPLLGVSVLVDDLGTWSVHLQLVLIRVMIGWVDSE